MSALLTREWKLGSSVPLLDEGNAETRTRGREEGVVEGERLWLKETESGASER